MIQTHDRQLIQGLAQNWKLTPATMMYKLSRGDWIPAKHLMYISARVARGIRRGGARIIISAPPRHGKSELLSIGTPTWVLEEFPTYKTILAGYGAELATGFSRRVRDVFTDESNFHLLNTRIRRDASRVEAFLTERGGGMYAVGLGGAITGRGAHVLLIDDYIKEIKEALSPTYRDYIWNWFTTTAFTRLEPGGSCIVIATRWHSDDLIGRILTNFPGEWEYIELPAIAEEGDILGRTPGEALFSERYDIGTLRGIQETLGSIFFSALYQQKPVDETKKITDAEWIKVVDMPPTYEMAKYKFARIWDLAATPGDGDFTVGSLVGYRKEDSRVLLCNIIRKQLSPGQVENLVKYTALVDGNEVVVAIEQEPGSAGKSLVNHFATNVLRGFKVVGIPVTQSKLVRAQPFIAAAEAGKVSMLAGSWNSPFIREFDDFPTGQHDDQVDTVSTGYTLLSGKKVFSASWGRSKVLNSGTKYKSSSMKLRSDMRVGSVKFSTGRSVGAATFGRRR